MITALLDPVDEITRGRLLGGAGGAALLTLGACGRTTIELDAPPKRVVAAPACSPRTPASASWSGCSAGSTADPRPSPGVRVDSQPEEIALSPETIAEGLGVAEVIVALTYPCTDQDEITASPLWRSIPAVRVAFVDGQSAFGNLGIAGLTAVLDDLRRQLTP